MENLTKARSQHEAVAVSDGAARALPRFGSWIAGLERQSEVAAWLKSIDPASGEPWAEVEAGDDSLVNLAVEDAHRAYLGVWRDLRPADRARYLIAIADVIRANVERLAEVESKDCGKAISETRAMIAGTPEWFEYFAGAVSKNVGESAPIRDGAVHYTTRVPYGVIGAIVPSNGPFVLATWKLAPALAAGNTVVIKPHEATSASLIELMRLIGDQLPPGVVNVVLGEGNLLGPAIVEHPTVRKITFTGGVPNGKRVAVGAAQRLVGSVLELGGKSANIVFADARYPNALAGVIAGIFSSTGQSCQAGSRILIQRDIYDRFLSDLVERAGSLRIGHPGDPNTEIGPMGSAAQLQRVLDFIASARDDGAQIAVGGNRVILPEYPNGYYVEPTIIAGATPDMSVCREEVFGPVGVVMPFDDEEEAISIANDSNFGLVAGLWTSDVYRVHRVADQLDVGTVYTNLYRKVAPEVPFGGFKNSGLGRENGMEIMREYSQVRSVLIETNEHRIQTQLMMRIGPEQPT